MSYVYYSNCVGWPHDDVHIDGGLCDMIRAETQITRRTFLSHVDRSDLRMLEERLSYDSHPKRGLTMAADYHVSYHRSVLHGQRVYFFTHSAIEYVFVRPEVRSCAA